MSRSLWVRPRMMAADRCGNGSFVFGFHCPSRMTHGFRRMQWAAVATK